MRMASRICTRVRQARKKAKLKAKEEYEIKHGALPPLPSLRGVDPRPTPRRRHLVGRASPFPAVSSGPRWQHACRDHRNSALVVSPPSRVRPAPRAGTVFDSYGRVMRWGKEAVRIECVKKTTKAGGYKCANRAPPTPATPPSSRMAASEGSPESVPRAGAPSRTAGSASALPPRRSLLRCADLSPLRRRTARCPPPYHPTHLCARRYRTKAEKMRTKIVKLDRQVQLNPRLHRPMLGTREAHAGARLGFVPDAQPRRHPCVDIVHSTPWSQSETRGQWCWQAAAWP